MMHKGPSYYKRPSYYRFSSSNVQLTESDTDLGNVIPVLDGVVNDDGSNTLSGTFGGDSTTDNTTIYKSGGGVSDVTAQNLISNVSSALKGWEITNLATNGVVVDATKMAGFNIYIIDSDTLALIRSSSAAIFADFGIDSSNYYRLEIDKDELSVGWNWISTKSVVVGDLDETGTVTGTIDYFRLIIGTDDAADTWGSGDVVFDLLRTWDSADTKKGIKAGYPLVNESEVYAEIPVI